MANFYEYNALENFSTPETTVFKTCDRVLEKLIKIKLFPNTMWRPMGHDEATLRRFLFSGPLLTRVDILLRVIVANDIADHPGKHGLPS